VIVETGSTAREPLRIVLLEDNPADARLVQESLRDCDTRIDCDIAAELWQVSPERLALADCALIDLGLPDATDMEAVQWIRDLAPQMPIVVLTGFDDEVTGLAALQKGAQDFLVKQHADGYLIARAIRFAVARMHLQSALDDRAVHTFDLQHEIVQRLFGICLAMKSTEGWARQPSVAERIRDHRLELERVMEAIRGTILIRQPETGNGAVHLP
jgi:DNA-binding response OmpR family regulator